MSRVHVGFEKVLEIDNAIFQDMEILERERFFKMAMEEFWIFVWKKSNIFYSGYILVSY